MSQQPQSFRDFGILPENLAPPAAVIRGYLSSGRIVGQYIGTGLCVAVGVTVAALLFWFAEKPLGYVGGLASLAGFGVFAYLMTKGDYGEVVLEGDEIRAKHLYTGRVVKRRVQEIERMTSIVYHGGTTEGAAVQALLGRIKGMEVRFRDGRTPLQILRSDPAMTNAQELLQGILYRMSQIDELEPEIVQANGRQLVRTIYWKAEPPANLKSSKTPLTALAVIFIVSALFIGPILTLMGAVMKDEFEVLQRLPQEITAADLIKNGPGDNRHVTITDFEPGGYVVESKNGTWTEVWIALFPSGGPEDKIELVISTKSVGNDGMLRQFAAQPKLTGICSKARRSSWGATLGPELVKANQNAPLASPWSVHQPREPVTEGFVNGVFTSAYITFGLVIAIALVVFGKDLIASISG